MSNTVLENQTATLPGRDCNIALATDPFTALKAHFGMLLGVADFQTIDAYHRGKQWLHNSWLHRQGVVWGFEVTVDADNDEIRVSPGLAVDALGRELHLAHPVCLNLPAWLDKHSDDPELQSAIIANGNTVQLNAYVMIQFKACLGRQVPALMEPCDGGGATSAYSRILETVEVILKPGSPPLAGELSRELPYHRLRLLFSLEDPIEQDGSIISSDQVVIDRRSQILGLPLADQPRAYLAAFREFAALESIEMRPAQIDGGEVVSDFPQTDPAPLILAALDDLIVEDSDFVSGEVDNTVRDTHVATATIQELLCGPLFSGSEEGGSPLPPDTSPVDAGGPRIDPQSVELEDDEILMSHSGPRFLARSLVAGTSVFVTAYDVNSGWSEAAISNVTYDSGTGQITVSLAIPPSSHLIRLVVKGTGTTPALATLPDSNRVPLAGPINGTPGGVHEGNDFVHMIRREG